MQTTPKPLPSRGTDLAWYFRPDSGETAFEAGNVRRAMRLSERMESLALVLQLMMLYRFVILLTGLGNPVLNAVTLNVTDLLVRPLNALVPTFQVGWFTLEPSSALLMLALPMLIGIITYLLDRIRLNGKHQRMIVSL